MSAAGAERKLTAVVDYFRFCPIPLNKSSFEVIAATATTAIRQAEMTAAKRMVERSITRFDLYPERLIGDSAYGSAEMLNWLVHEQGIEPHIPVFDNDQIVVRIGKEGGSAVRCGPPRRRIGRCNELGCDLGCSPERGIVENGQILLNRAACRVPRQTRGTFNTGAVAGIGLDQAGIDGESRREPFTLSGCRTAVRLLGHLASDDADRPAVHSALCPYVCGIDADGGFGAIALKK